VEEFKYLGTTLMTQISIQKEIKRRLKSKDACYHSGQNLFSSSFLSKHTKIKTHRIIILPVALYGCETWSLTLREKSRLRVYENRMLRRIFGSKRDELAEEWKTLNSEELNDLHTSPNIILVIKSRRRIWAWHVARMGKGELHRGFWWGNPRESDHFEDPGVDGRIILRSIFRKWNGGMN